MDNRYIDVIRIYPDIVQFLSAENRIAYYKSAPITRDDLERRVGRAISKIDRVYLAMLETNGVNVPFDFWASYAADLRAEIATPMRQYIEQSFSNYSDYVNFIDKAGAVGDIDTMMTRAITESANGIAANTRLQLQALVGSGITDDEIVERIAMRFGSGHAEQVAVTEITRAEGYFSDALSGRLAEQGVQTNIRWLAAEDEKMCPVCRKLDGQNKPPGGWVTIGNVVLQSPPAHPNCRCKTVVELAK